jgi:dolichyl-phosphate-mannose-protein mannosyltransferase
MPRRRPERSAAPEPIPFGPPVSRGERYAVAAIVLIAVALRFAYPGRMAIEHFDEGVYASNIFFGAEDGYRYPYRHLYAPPLLPWLIEWCIVFLGPQGIAPFLPALVLGTATVPLAWWATRCWFGPIAGLAAGFLFATSDFHILYSRTALTDAPVAFFILLAVYLYWEAVRRESLRWSLAAGVATGLAWWTKYTGWLPLAIAGAGSLAWVIFQWQSAGSTVMSRLWITAKCFGTTAVTALIVWSPVLIGLQDYGGYAAVAENHAGYLDDWINWHRHIWFQAGNVSQQSGTLTVLGIAVFAGVIPFRTRWMTAVRIAVAIWSAFIAGWATYQCGPAAPLALLALFIFGIELLMPTRVDWNSTQQPDPTARRQDLRGLAGWLLAAWFCGMLLTTPLYYPYPRLVMPWLMAALLGACLWLAPSRETPALRWPVNRSELFPAVLLLLPLVAWLPFWESTGWTSPGWEDRSLLRSAGRTFAKAVEEDAADRSKPTLVYVAGDPAMFFNLAAAVRQDRTAVVPLASGPQDYSRLDEIQTYLFTLGAQLEDPASRRIVFDYWEYEELPVSPIARQQSRLTELDTLSNARVWGNSWRADELKLFRVVPPTQSR